MYNKIDVKNGKTTFESIVKVSEHYYTALIQDYILCYHCKSGKDRTSIFDAVVQATFYYIKNTRKLADEKIKSSDYEAIRLLSQKFLMFGFIPAYYGTGFIGLKLGSNPDLATYILGKDLYKFYLGHGLKAGSSS